MQCSMQCFKRSQCHGRWGSSTSPSPVVARRTPLFFDAHISTDPVASMQSRNAEPFGVEQLLAARLLAHSCTLVSSRPCLRTEAAGLVRQEKQRGVCWGRQPLTCSTLNHRARLRNWKGWWIASSPRTGFTLMRRPSQSESVSIALHAALSSESGYIDAGDGTWLEWMDEWY